VSRKRVERGNVMAVVGMTLFRVWVDRCWRVLMLIRPVFTPRSSMVNPITAAVVLLELKNPS
jgi:hypothetical protein